MREQNAASVEEILESIKKVIARDNRTGAIIERRKREEEGVVKDDSGAGNEEILDLGTAELIDDDFEDNGTAETGDDANDDTNDEASPLIADKARDSMRENLAALAMLAEPGARPQIVRSGETSLEGLAREMLRPMLAQWLDSNLPDMVEKMVKAEISRIAGKRS